METLERKIRARGPEGRKALKMRVSTDPATVPARRRKRSSPVPFLICATENLSKDVG